MSAPIIQGWCPGALRPMASGDGLVLRIRTPLSRLSAAQAKEIASLAARHGNGLIDLSARANLQLRGVSPQSHAPLIAGLRALGLIDADAAREARRNILLSPFRREDDACAALALALAAALAAEDAPDLPGKFGFVLDTGREPCLRGIAADIRIERDAAGGLVVAAEGAGRGAAVAQGEAVAAAMALARWFLASGGTSSGGRMRRHLAQGAILPPRFLATPLQGGTVPTPAPGPVAQGVLVGLAFGQMHAQTLAALADFGDLRLTPWRMLLIEGATAAPPVPEIITVAEDPLRRVIACTGAPGCGQALRPTRPLARALAPLLPEGGLLHVSGCAKGCAHPGPASLTLVATRQGFDLIRAGHAAAAATITGLAPEAKSIAKGF